MTDRKAQISVAFIALLIVTVIGTVTLSGNSFRQLIGSSADPVPETVTYQGYLTDSRGNPLDSRSTEITFRLYTAATRGKPAWEEVRQVNIESGVFTVELGTVRSLSDVLNRSPLFLGVQVGTTAELAPRQKLTSVPFAVRSADADSLGGKAASDYVTQDELTVAGTCALELRLRQRFFDFVLADECIPSSTFDGDILGLMENSAGQVTVLHMESGNLAVSVCLSPSCESRDTQQLTEVALKNSAAIARGKDGFPIISYNTSDSLKMLVCNTANCSSRTRITLDQVKEVVYAESTIILGRDGNAFIAYNTNNGQTGAAFSSDLRTAYCRNESCSSVALNVQESAGTINSMFNTVTGTGATPRVILDANGLPLVIYRKGQQERVMMMSCDTEECRKPTITDIALDAGRGHDVALGADGLPEVLYTNFSIGSSLARLIRCQQTLCSSGTARSARLNVNGAGDDSVNSGFSAEIEFTSDGQDHIAYLQSTVGLVYARCLDNLCQEVIGAVIGPDPDQIFAPSVETFDALLFITKDDRIIMAGARTIYDCTEFCGGLK